MRWITFGAVAVTVMVFGALVFRVINLEQRVELLSRQLGAPSQGEPRDGRAVASTGGASQATGLELRLSALEKRVAQLAEAKTARPGAAEGVSALQKEDAILSVVQRENERIRDVQLEWHSGRWLENREQQLITFATQQKLDPPQTAELHDVLKREIDRMVDVLKRPNMMDDPDQAARDWLGVLAETDERAMRILKTPEQRQSWVAGRTFERRVLWPWLPEDSAARK